MNPLFKIYFLGELLSFTKLKSNCHGVLKFGYEPNGEEQLVEWLYGQSTLLVDSHLLKNFNLAVPINILKLSLDTDRVSINYCLVICF